VVDPVHEADDLDQFLRQRGQLRARADGKPLEFISDAQKLAYNPAIALFAFMYAGCVWNFYVSSFTPPEITHRTLRKDGTLPIIVSDFRDYFKTNRQ
jgi:hypothetical protein